MSSKNGQITDKQLARLSSYGVAIIIALLPVHALISTWAGANFGNPDLFKVWKELLIVILTVPVAALLFKDKKLRRQLADSIIVKLVLIYIIITLLRTSYGLSNAVINTEAAAYGLLANLRPFVFLILVWIISSKDNWLARFWQRLVLIPGAVVVSFGILQQFILPKDFLSHFGYGSESIRPYQAVDQKPNFIRAQSSLRGPNPLGAYLVLLGTMLADKFLRGRNIRSFIIMSVTIVLLFFTYSRSAWIGFSVSLACLLLIRYPKIWRRFLLAGVVGVLLLSGVVYVLRDNDWLQNVVFHSDETSVSATSSNEARFNHLSSGLKDVLKNPLGDGAGSAGPASLRNDKPAKIAENYYIQIAQESGVIGLLAFVAISVFTALSLWRRRTQDLAVLLLSTFVGLYVVNLFSHAWMDDTLALLWWGLAGIAIASPAILKDKQYGQKTNKG